MGKLASSLWAACYARIGQLSHRWPGEACALTPAAAPWRAEFLQLQHRLLLLADPPLKPVNAGLPCIMCPSLALLLSLHFLHALRQACQKLSIRSLLLLHHCQGFLHLVQPAPACTTCSAAPPGGCLGPHMRSAGPGTGCPGLACTAWQPDRAPVKSAMIVLVMHGALLTVLAVGMHAIKLQLLLHMWLNVGNAAVRCCPCSQSTAISVVHPSKGRSRP